MNFFDNFPPGLIVMMIVVVALFVAIMIFIVVIPTIKAWKLKKANIEAIIREDERVANLPKLKTLFLLKIPECVTRFAKGEPRTFGTRYNRLIVFDEKGEGWVGLFMPFTFKGLRDGEYVQKSYWIPFRGPGEAYGGDPAVVDGQKIIIYPTWLSATATDSYSWRTWATLEKAFAEAHPRGVSYFDEFHQFTPPERSYGLEQHRQEFEALRRALTPKKKK